MPIIGVSKMSRTHRNVDNIHRHAFRFPKTENERKQLNGILHDEEFLKFPVSGFNHMKKRENHLPSSWNDEIVSAYYQEDFNEKF
jgi:hypothetical protein